MSEPAEADPMKKTRPTTANHVLLSLGMAAAIALAVFRAPTANWNFALFGILLGFSVFSDLTAIETKSRLKISGSFLAIVLAIVFLGGTPAAIIGAASIVFGWFRWRDDAHDFLVNLLTYVTFPLVSGIAFHTVIENGGITTSSSAFYLFIFATFLLALAINFSMIAADACYLDRSSFAAKVRSALFPLLPSELMAALMTVGVAYLYVQVGLAGVALFGVVLVTFQYLLGALLVSQQRAEGRELRRKQLASFRVGMLGAMLPPLDLRAKMPARHSAAVARYSRAIAQRAGYSRREE